MEHSFKYTHTLVTKKSDNCGNFIGGFDRCASPLHLTMCMPMFIFNQVSRHVFTRSRSYFFRLILLLFCFTCYRAWIVEGGVQKIVNDVTSTSAWDVWSDHDSLLFSFSDGQTRRCWWSGRIKRQVLLCMMMITPEKKKRKPKRRGKQRRIPGKKTPSVCNPSFSVWPAGRARITIIRTSPPWYNERYVSQQVYM